MFNNFNPTKGNDAGNNKNTGSIPIGIPMPQNQQDDDDGLDVESFLINYNEKFKNSDKILYRDAVIQQTISCLIGKFKPNALLIGAAGVGKTKIVEDIARRIANKDSLIPSQLADYTIWELPLSNIVSGSGLVGELERKTKAIIDYASNPENKAILFIDEIHVLVGESQTYDRIAQLMKPALARGDMKVIGATTLQESQNLMDDPAFNRRFTRLIVDELTQSQTKEIISNMSTSMFEHYEKRVVINPNIIDDIVTIADEFKTVGSHRPDNAITLLDRAMADAVIQRKTIEAKAKEENDTAILTILQVSPTIILSRSQIKKTALRLMTGNHKRDDVDISHLKESLKVIKGQDETIDYVVDALKRDSLGLYPRTKPLTLLFAGNSGVGKTEVAKIIAQELTNVKPIVINMTEYHSPSSINRLIGSPAGYIGSDSKTELPFDMLETNPYQVILLDEFEKGDNAVQRLFMSAFDEGYIKTAKGKTIDFSKAIIIATTNAGHTGKTGESIGFTKSAKNENATVNDLSNVFDAELLNRFTKILTFNPITEELFKEILADRYRRDVADIKKNHVSYSFLQNELSDEQIKDMTKKNYNKLFGARPIKNIVQKYIEDMVIDYRYGNNETDENEVNENEADVATNVATNVDSDSAQKT